MTSRFAHRGAYPGPLGRSWSTSAFLVAMLALVDVPDAFAEPFLTCQQVKGFFTVFVKGVIWVSFGMPFCALPPSCMNRKKCDCVPPLSDLRVHCPIDSRVELFRGGLHGFWNLLQLSRDLYSRVSYFSNLSSGFKLPICERGGAVFGFLFCALLYLPLLPACVAVVASVTSHAELSAVISSSSYETEETIIYFTENITVSGEITFRNTDQNVSMIGLCSDNCFIQQEADFRTFVLNNGDAEDSYVRFENMGFIGANYAAWDNGGGAFLLTRASNVVFSRCTFVDNKARSAGGAMRVMAVTTLLFDSCSFIRNSAQVMFGGAVALHPCCWTALNDVIFSNCFFDSNSAPQFADVKVESGFTATFSGTNLMASLPDGGGTIVYAPSPPSAPPPPNLCDSTMAPVDGSLGDCPASLASGSTCQPTCNEGYTVSGTTSCNAGALDKATCIPKSCAASTDITKDGSDGSIHCGEHGTVGGVTNSCTCTCAAGWDGSGCETAKACTASAESAKDGSDGELHCSAQ